MGQAHRTCFVCANDLAAQVGTLSGIIGHGSTSVAVSIEDAANIIQSPKRTAKQPPTMQTQVGLANRNGSPPLEFSIVLALQPSAIPIIAGYAVHSPSALLFVFFFFFFFFLCSGDASWPSYVRAQSLLRGVSGPLDAPPVPSEDGQRHEGVWFAFAAPHSADTNAILLACGSACRGTRVSSGATGRMGVVT
jgi:hypothetical protein